MNSIHQRNGEIESRKNDIIDTILKNILLPQLHKEQISFSELKKKVDILDGTFSHVKKMFSGRLRDNGEDAFIHQIEVVELLLQHSKNITFEKILILLEHDTIEDTDISIEGMTESHNDINVVFCVALMTKDPFINFINVSQDKKKLDNIRKSGILNKKGNINDSFNDKLRENKHLTPLEEKSYNDYKILSEQYKPLRNKKYSENMKTIEGFEDHAMRVNINHGFNLSLEEIDKNLIIALECKLIDRLHGIKTLSNCSIDKIQRKIEETYTYYKEISIKFFPHLWKLIEIELSKVQDFLIHKKNNTISDTIKPKVNVILGDKQLNFSFINDEK